MPKKQKDALLKETILSLLIESEACRNNKNVLYCHVAKRLNLYHLGHFELLEALDTETVRRERQTMQEECNHAIIAGLPVTDIRGKEYIKRQEKAQQIRIIKSPHNKYNNSFYLFHLLSCKPSQKKENNQQM